MLKKDSKLFKFFQGKYINVLMRSVKGSQSIGDGVMAEGNVILSGYLLDSDDEFFYIGSPDGDIEDALKQDDVVRIYLGDIIENNFPFGEEGDMH